MLRQSPVAAAAALASPAQNEQWLCEPSAWEVPDACCPSEHVAALFDVACCSLAHIICFFGGDYQTADFCRQWRPAMACGLLRHVCSGGSSALGFPWPPPEGTTINGRKVMRWRRTSVAKSTAYMFALATRRRLLQGRQQQWRQSPLQAPFSLVLCCLNTDNIMGINCLRAVLNQAAQSKYSGWVLHCCGSSAGRRRWASLLLGRRLCSPRRL